MRSWVGWKPGSAGLSPCTCRRLSRRRRVSERGLTRAYMHLHSNAHQVTRCGCGAWPLAAPPGQQQRAQSPPFSPAARAPSLAGAGAAPQGRASSSARVCGSARAVAPGRAPIRLLPEGQAERSSTVVGHAGACTRDWRRAPYRRAGRGAPCCGSSAACKGSFRASPCLPEEPRHPPTHPPDPGCGFSAVAADGTPEAASAARRGRSGDQAGGRLQVTGPCLVCPVQVSRGKVQTSPQSSSMLLHSAPQPPSPASRAAATPAAAPPTWLPSRSRAASLSPPVAGGAGGGGWCAPLDAAQPRASVVDAVLPTAQNPSHSDLLAAAPAAGAVCAAAVTVSW